MVTYNCTYMAQLTIYLDDQTEKLLKTHVESSGESASKWVAEAVRRRANSEWPADILSLFGSWKDEDFLDTSELRRGFGKDVRREKI